MNNTTIDNGQVFEMWNTQKMSFKEISQVPFPTLASIKRIRNIIYGGRTRLKSDFEKDVYRIFRLKFLELQNINASIWFVYENQPDHCIKEITVRYIIKKELKKRMSKKQVVR